MVHGCTSEEDQISELKRRCEPVLPSALYDDETVFKRFLRARKHNVDAAEHMLRNHLNWRKLHDVDNILTNYKPSELFSKYAPLNLLGFDSRGYAVVYSQFGNLDTKGFVKSATRLEMHKYIAYFIEGVTCEMNRINKMSGKGIEKYFVVFNFENFPLSYATHKPTLETLASIAAMYEANFPERLKIAYFVNAAFYVTLAWSLIKPFLSPETAEKVKLFGKSGWQEDLIRSVDANILPAFLGGDRTDPDGNPSCNTVITYGGLIPESFYKTTPKNRIQSLENGKKLSVNRMSKEHVCVEIIYPGSAIEWQFYVKSGDIGFSLLYKANSNSDSGFSELLPFQRIEATDPSESNFFHCDKTGVYILEFNNSYSWIHSKEIFFDVSIVSPKKLNSSVHA